MAAAVAQEVLGVVPDVCRAWLQMRTGYEPQQLINTILDNMENIPREGGSQMSLNISMASEDGDALADMADNWIQRIASSEKKDDVVAALINAFKEMPAVSPSRRANYQEWNQIKSYVEKKFPHVKQLRLQKLFSQAHVASYKMSFILAALSQLGRFTQAVADELGIRHLWSADWKLKVPRRARPPAPPAILVDSEMAISQVVETVLGDPGERISCCVCYDEYFPKWMMHCGEMEETLGGHFYWSIQLEISDPHHVCLGCFREQGKALCTDGKLAEGGQGLTCVESCCDRIYPWAKVKKMLDAKTRMMLGKRIDQEALVVVGDELERCKACSFAMIIEAPTDEVRFFDCPRCRANFCRTCKGKWKEHAGRSCQEMNALEDEKDQARKRLEEELAAAVMRKCHKCGIQFAKEEGCNKMTCRCGATQCYICRAVDIDYKHFCNHVHDPARPGCPAKCGGCILWEKRDNIDKAALDAVKEKALADEKLRGLVENIGGQ